MTAVGIIVNPNSRKNRGRSDRSEKLQRIVGDYGIVRQTRDIEEISPVLAEFVDRGVHYWVSDGGDGALHWMINKGSVLTCPDVLPGRPDIFPHVIVPTNGGTIDFVAKKARIKGYTEDIVEKLVRMKSRGLDCNLVEIDSLRIEGMIKTERGIEPFEKIGFATAIGGIGQRFFDKYYAEERLGPLAIVNVIAKAVSSFLLNAVPGNRVFPSRLKDYAGEIFKPEEATVIIDGQKLEYETWGAIHAGSLDINLGGVIRVFGMAEEEGALQFQAGSITPIEMITNLPNLFRGTKIKSRRLCDTIGSKMSVFAENEAGLRPVIDGELFEGVMEIHVSAGPKIRVPSIP